jgi:hypothetical protein
MTEELVKPGDYIAMVREAKISEFQGIFSDTLGDQVKIIYELQEGGKVLLEWYYLRASHFKNTVEAILGHSLRGEEINLGDLVGKKCLLTIDNEISGEKTKNKIIDIKSIKSGKKESKTPLVDEERYESIFGRILENDASGAENPLPILEVTNALPNWLERDYESYILLMDALKRLNEAIKTQNSITIGKISRDVLVVFEYVIARGEGGQPPKDAHFHKATIYVRQADRCDPRFEADTQMKYLQAARNSISKAVSMPQLVHPNFLKLQENIVMRIEKWPYSLG